jgi:PST family polysaccharide transporter
MSWLCTVIVARLLSPADYGLIGMATVFIGLVMLVSEFGMGVAIVSLRDLSREQVAQLNTLSVLFGVGWVLLACAAAYPLSIFFHAGQLPAVIAAMSVSFLITAFKVVPDALLQKDLQFRTISGIEAARTATTAAVTVLTAALGWGYWSLVVGNVIGVATSTAATLRQRRHPFQWIQLEQLRKSLRFSWHIIVSRITWYGYSNSDFVVAGRTLGQTALGSYTFAWTLASLPVDKISSMVVRVLPPFFSAVQTEKAELRRYVLALTEGLLLITLPVSLGIALVAGRMIRVIFGTKWESAAAPLAILALYASIRSITTIFSPLLVARGQARYPMWINIAALMYFPVGFYVGSHWGTLGIALVWVLLYPLVALPLYWRAFHEIDMPVASYLGALRPALQASAAMMAAVLLTRWIAQGYSSDVIGLVAETATGALAYAAVLLAFFRDRLVSFYRIIRPTAGDSPQVPPTASPELADNADSIA